MNARDYDNIPTDALVHLVWGGKTLCGLTPAEAARTYHPRAANCPKCGPRSAPNYALLDDEKKVPRASDVRSSCWPPRPIEPDGAST
jgi:hypothetical protein